MQIARVEVYGYTLRYRHGSYVMSSGRVVTELDSTLVRLVADDGRDGWGEVCPLGPTYLPAFAGGVRAALRELAPAVLGLDPREPDVVGRRLDATLRGQPFGKSPIDIACWDLAGKAAGVSVATLLGGRHQERFPLYEAVPLGSSAEMVAFVDARRAEGIRHFQLKVGADPYEDAARVRAVVTATSDDDRIIVDANGGWQLQDAMVAARLLADLPRVYLEQPCQTLEECLYVRRHTALPLILDEVVNDVPSLLRAVHEGGLEAFNLKIARVGGLTRARLLRDLAVALGLKLTIEDAWGGDVTTAAISQLVASTPPSNLFTTSFMNDWVEEHVAGYQPRSAHGVGATPSGPGLGVTVAVARLGAPLFVAGEAG